jgi:hypothetical protein
MRTRGLVVWEEVKPGISVTRIPWRPLQQLFRHDFLHFLAQVTEFRITLLGHSVADFSTALSGDSKGAFFLLEDSVWCQPCNGELARLSVLFHGVGVNLEGRCKRSTFLLPVVY